MQEIVIPDTFAELFELLEKNVPPEDILAFHPTKESEERAEELLEKNREGTLTLEEQIELEQMVYVDRKMSLLKSRALIKLDQA